MKSTPINGVLSADFKVIFSFFVGTLLVKLFTKCFENLNIYKIYTNFFII